MLPLLRLLPRRPASRHCSLSRRGLTSSEVATALRPFFFLVHPDLFGKYPLEQAANENALKMLNAYIDCLVGKSKTPSPINVDFFLKNRSSGPKDRASLSKININLRKTSTSECIRYILEESNLPTSYLDTIVNRNGVKPTEDVSNPLEEYEEPTPTSRSSSRPMQQTLIEWLKNNVDTARERLAKTEPRRLETEKIQDEIVLTHGLEDILWDCGWDAVYRKGVLDSFSFLLNNHPEVGGILRGKVIVFGNVSSGVSLDGSIILYIGEVRINWLRVLTKKVTEMQRVLETIPVAEKTLSQALRNIRVVKRKLQPITMVEDYRVRLRKVFTSVGDYKSRQNFPSAWPESLDDLELCVETESSPLMVSPSGQFIVPAGCPNFLLISFLTEHMDEARLRLRESRALAAEEASLKVRCMGELGLIELSVDDGITTEATCNCFVRLLQSADSIRHLTHGNHLVISRYYAVTADGSIFVPCNWD